MTRIVQSGLSGGSRKISGAHSCSWPMQKGHCCCWSELGLMVDLDLKSEGRLALAGEKITHRSSLSLSSVAGFELLNLMPLPSLCVS